MGRYIDAAKTLYHRLRKARRIKPASVPEKKEILRALRTQGYFVIPGYYDRAKCDELLAEMKRVFVEYESTLWNDALKSDTRVYAIDRVSPLMRQFHTDPLLTEISQLYIPHQECFFTLANRVRVVPGNLGSGGGWHRDTPWERQFKGLLYLADVGEGGGAFEYLPASHHVGRLVRTITSCGIKFGQNRLTEEEVARIAKHFGVEPVRFTAPAGTLILVDTSGIHRGRPIEQGERYAITNYYFAPEVIAAHKAAGKFTGYFVDRDPLLQAPSVAEMTQMG